MNIRHIASLSAALLLAACASAPDTSAYQKERADKGQVELDRNIDRQDANKDE